MNKNYDFEDSSEKSNTKRTVKRNNFVDNKSIE